MNERPRWALLASDCTTLPDLRCVLALAGYHVQNVYSLAAVEEALSDDTPDLTVVGPFRDSSGVHTLLRRLHQIEAELVVMSLDADTIALAERLHMRVRPPAQRVYLDPPLLRTMALN